jgi:hypothetical protein
MHFKCTHAGIKPTEDCNFSLPIMCLFKKDVHVFENLLSLWLMVAFSTSLAFQKSRADHAKSSCLKGIK